jgi:hypothetical protein
MEPAAGRAWFATNSQAATITADEATECSGNETATATAGNDCE